MSPKNTASVNNKFSQLNQFSQQVETAYAKQKISFIKRENWPLRGVKLQIKQNILANAIVCQADKGESFIARKFLKTSLLYFLIYI